MCVCVGECFAGKEEGRRSRGDEKSEAEHRRETEREILCRWRVEPDAVPGKQREPLKVGCLLFSSCDIYSRNYLDDLKASGSSACLRARIPASLSLSLSLAISASYELKNELLDT